MMVRFFAVLYFTESDVPTNMNLQKGLFAVKLFWKPDISPAMEAIPGVCVIATKPT